MPLYQDAKYLIRANLECLQRGEKVRAVVIGQLTEVQHITINTYRESQGLPVLESAEVVFLGKHMYNSRVMGDGYTIDDVIEQIESALAETAVVMADPRMTATQSSTPRADAYGNTVFDRAIYELTQRKPRAELFSVMPKGDKNKPPRR